MPNISLFAISGLLIIFAYLPLIVLIGLKGNNITKLYGLHLVCVFFWGLGAFLIGITKDLEIVALVWKFTYSAILFIPVFFLHYVLLITNKHSKAIIYIAYFQAIFFTIITLNGKMWSNLHLIFNSILYYDGNELYLYSFVLWLLITLYAHFILIKHYQICFPSLKKQISLLIISLPFGFCGGIINFLPPFGINIYPFGNFLIPIYSLIATYAILRHQLFDITIAIRKSIVYSILISLLSLSYLLFVVVAEKLLQNIIGYQSFLISITIAFLLGSLFVLVKNKIENIVDRIFFKGTQAEIAQENQLLRREIAQTERLRTVATLASGIAHEIKNPLTALRTFTEFLPKKSHDKAFITKFSRIVRNEVDRIDNLVHQLLDFARPATPVIERTNLNRLVDDTLNFISYRFIEKNISLTKDFSPGNKNPIFTDIDPHQIRQAVFNIFLNSIDAMNRGGNLNVSLKKIGQDENFCEIVITDTGCGISQEDLPHIFDPFFTKKDGGTGLGLSITHQIIVEHKGTIEVESQEGRGTTFKIRLPTAGS